MYMYMYFYLLSKNKAPHKYAIIFVNITFILILSVYRYSARTTLAWLNLTPYNSISFCFQN